MIITLIYICLIDLKSLTGKELIKFTILFLDFGCFQDCQHGLVSGSTAREWWSIHPDDPLSAEARTHWSTENSRGTWSVRTETFAKMTSDKEMFYLEAKLEAYEGEKLVFEKEICQSVPRNHR